MNRVFRVAAILFMVCLLIVGCQPQEIGPTAMDQANLDQVNLNPEQHELKLNEEPDEMDNIEDLTEGSERQTDPIEEEQTPETVGLTEQKGSKPQLTDDRTGAPSTTAPTKPHAGQQTESGNEVVTKPQEGVILPTEDAASDNLTTNPVPDETEPEAALPETSSVFLTIQGAGDIGVILERTAVEFEEGDTVLQVLKKVTRAQKIHMEYRGGNGSLAYVAGIDNIYEFDHGPSSGWLYEVNGERPRKGAGITKLELGDEVKWLYVVREDPKAEGGEG